jgi:Coenzyme PQQ synthesis protein D (PqqD)
MLLNLSEVLRTTLLYRKFSPFTSLRRTQSGKVGPMLSSVPHLRSVVDQDGAVILDIEHDAMLTLNSTGGYIWARFQQGKLIEEIISDLSRDTGVDAAVVERDVYAFLEQLKSRHVLAEPERERSFNRFNRLSRLP